MDTNLSPNVPNGNFALIQVEVRTGIVLTLVGRRFCGGGERFLFFDAREKALAKAHDIVKQNREIEVVVHDSTNKEIAHIKR